MYRTNNKYDFKVDPIEGCPFCGCQSIKKERLWRYTFEEWCVQCGWVRVTEMDNDIRSPRLLIGFRTRTPLETVPDFMFAETETDREKELMAYIGIF